ncbi:hypothetical protein CerSpe_094190 [Prunus speciosa]
MEKHRICKICNKRFANGKAMGGHMRSHLAKLPLPAKPQSPQQQQQQQQQLSNSPESSPPLSSTNRAMHSSPSLDSAIHDGDSDTESHPRNPTRRRSKRRRKVIGKAAEAALEAEQVSSVSDAFSTEDVARCLIMLSMDKWGKWEKAKLKKEVDESVDEDEDEDESAFRAQTGALTLGKYKCETCNKAFRSYQALGGHRASHKKIIKTQVFDVEDDDDDDFEEEEEDDDDVIGNNGNSGNLVVDQQRTFECSFCFKQFDSGQALGGHKKVHYYNNLTHNARNVSSSSTNFVDNLVIDLNLPAPEEEDGELSQLEFSTVSD